MILISQNVTNYNIPIPENAVFRINLAWVNSIDALQGLLESHKAHDIFLDLPTNRLKPPNNRYSLRDISSILENRSNVKYLAVSNVDEKEDLDDYIANIPKGITVVPKIESHIGVDNIEGIIGKLQYRERIVMLDHDDLYTNLLQSDIPAERFSTYINRLVDVCRTHDVLLLRTIGIIFADETRLVSDYVP
jgi:citrate lyase beta subunit